MHRCAGRNSIIHEYDGTTLYVISRAVSTVEAFAPLQFLLLLCCDLIDHLAGYIQELHDIGIEYAHAARRDGPHRQFFLPWYTKLADDHDIQWSMERSGHFKCNGNAATRQSQHKYILQVSVSSKLCRQ